MPSLTGPSGRLVPRNSVCRDTRWQHRSIFKQKALSTVTPSSAKTTEVIQLQAVEVTAENFQPYGQIIAPTDDGKPFDNEDAQLSLDHGTPRFYIMRLPARGLTFDRITYHADVTQCLASVQPRPWYMVVASPSGIVSNYPTKDQLAAFRVPHGIALKLHQGTWHAGPLFDGDKDIDFFNLELADTNVVDHNTHDYSEQGIDFQVVSDLQ